MFSWVPRILSRRIRTIRLLPISGRCRLGTKTSTTRNIHTRWISATSSIRPRASTRVLERVQTRRHVCSFLFDKLFFIRNRIWHKTMEIGLSCLHSCHRVFILLWFREIWVAGVLQPSFHSCHLHDSAGQIVYRRKSWRSFEKSWRRVGRRNSLFGWCIQILHFVQNDTTSTLKNGWVAGV